MRRPSLALSTLLAVTLLVGIGTTAQRVGWVEGWLSRDSARSHADREGAAEAPWERAAPPPVDPAAAPKADPVAVRRVLADRLGAAQLGPRVLVEVADMADPAAAPLVSRGSGAAVPASTTKLLTTAAALHVFGPETRFATRVMSPRPGALILVGGGDPMLTSRPARKRAASDPDAPASIVTLAARTGEALRAAGTTRVRVAFDDHLFSGPTISPTWPASFVAQDIVSPLSALRVDEGHLRGGGRDRTPSETATAAFVRALQAQGIKVRGKIGPARKADWARAQWEGTAPHEIARVESAPLSDIVAHTLGASDNDAAETLAHLVGARAGDGSFEGGATAIRAALTKLAVPLADVHLVDGSGLSHADVLTPAALTAVLRRSLSDPDLQVLNYGLPIGGLSGSLIERFRDKSTSAGAGWVRAKTGTLTGVSSLAGFITTVDGATLSYVVLADRVPAGRTEAARQALDDAAAALATCHCAA